ncbi:acyl carrier protein [Hankyongella ginsenosidimutans]|uniref:Acyl carrier protein n=1 Tax=Hankyongella ginsenosidimutans TaxID=1763828 RepID=A0A4D7C150_9SPHN|nr:acyl carrier protein [Hankyongella ginsenosidimutans]QCI78771.1 acyl carrier protein [Hankyongella ginsenosidimutans]
MAETAANPAAPVAQVRELLTETLGLGARGAMLTAASPLLGALPELDSMAVATVLTALEERFGILIDDDDVSAETFETLGDLAALVARKTA